MNRLLLLCALFPVLALAEPSEEAQKKAEAAAVKSCQVAKDFVARQEACADEHTELVAVICSDPASRQTVDPKKLSADCSKKLKVKPAPAKKKAPARR